MTSALAVDLLGYFAAVLIAFGLTRTSVLRLRLFSLAGGLTFVVYGFVIGAIPVAVTNAILASINVYFLLKLRRHHEVYSLLEVDTDSAYMLEFLRFHDSDIRSFMPQFSYVPKQAQVRLFVLRDMMPVGLFIGDAGPDGSMTVLLDYATPGYRDLGVAKYLYDSATESFSKRGVGRLISEAGQPAHERYLCKVGYLPEGDVWVRNL